MNNSDNNNKRIRVSTEKDGHILSLCEDTMRNVLEFLGLSRHFSLVCKTFAKHFDNAPYHKSKKRGVFVNIAWAAKVTGMDEKDTKTFTTETISRCMRGHLRGSRKFSHVRNFSSCIWGMDTHVMAFAKRLPLSFDDYENMVGLRLQGLIVPQPKSELLKREIQEIFGDLTHTQQHTGRELQEISAKYSDGDVKLGKLLWHKGEEAKPCSKIISEIFDFKSIFDTLRNLSLDSDSDSSMSIERKQVKSLFVHAYHKRVAETMGEVRDIHSKKFKRMIFGFLSGDASSDSGKKGKISSIVVSEMARLAHERLLERIYDIPADCLLGLGARSNGPEGENEEESKKVLNTLVSVFSPGYLSVLFTRQTSTFRRILKKLPGYLVDELLLRFDKNVRPTLHNSFYELMRDLDFKLVESSVLIKLSEFKNYKKLMVFYPSGSENDDGSDDQNE